MPITKDKLLAVVVLLINGFLGAVVGNFSENLLLEAAFAVLFSLPGLLLIWKKEVFAKTALIRGIPRDLPPGFVAFIGWVFLLVFPILYVYQLSQH